MIMVSNLRTIKNIHFGIRLANTIKRKLTFLGIMMAPNMLMGL